MGSSSSRGRGRPRIPAEKLIAHLRELADELGKTPSAGEMRELGAHSDYQYRARFETWNNAIDEAGLERNRNGEPCQYSDAELIEDIQRVADELGKTPTASEISDHGIAGLNTYARRLGSGSWSAACEAAGLEPNKFGGALGYDSSPVAEVEQAARDYVGGKNDEWRNTTTFKAKFLDLPDMSTRQIGQSLMALEDRGIVEKVNNGSNCYAWRFTEQDQGEAQEQKHEQGQAQGTIPADAD